MIVGKAISWGKKGEKISVRLPDGQIKTYIADQDILSNSVLVVGDRVIGNDQSVLTTTRTVDFYRSKTTVADEPAPLFATLWLRTVASSMPIPLVNPRWHVERERSLSPLLESARARITGDGAGDHTRPPTNFLLNLEGVQGQGVERYFNSFDSQEEAARAFHDPTYEPRSGSELINALVAGSLPILDFTNPPTDRDYIYTLRHSLTDTWLTANYGEGTDAQLVSCNIDHVTISGIDGFTEIATGVYQKTVRAGEDHPNIRVVLDQITPPPGLERMGLLTYTVFAQLDISTPYQHWYSNGDRTEYWLNLATDTSNAVKVLELDKFEAVRLFMTTLPDKVYLIAKIGKSHRPQVLVQGRLRPADFNTAHWMQIRVIKVSLTGQLETRIYNYPEEPEGDPDNNQPWAYSYVDMDSSDHPWVNDCHFQTSVATRRQYAFESDYVGSQYQENVGDRHFEGRLIGYGFSPPRDRLLRANEYNVINPPSEI